jgi:hypothetical protein
MGIRLEKVDPLAFAGPASLILQEARESPALRYTPEYLRWLFSFPGGSSTVAAAAFDGDEPIGFRAVMPRRARFRGQSIVVHLSSFLSVRSAWRGPIAAGLHRTICGMGLPRPWIAFARPGTTGERVTRAQFTSFKTSSQKEIGIYRTYGYVDPPTPLPSGVSCGEADDLDEFLAIARRCTDPRVLWSDPDHATLEHYRKDPRGRALVVARSASGDPLAVAMAVRAEIVAPNGVEYATMVDSVFLPESSAEALRALLRFAGRRWTESGKPAVVTAPNLWGLDPALLRSAGLRATPSSFVGFLLAPEPGDPLVKAEGTNLEVV